MTIRPLRKEETELLKAFLYEAIFIPEGVEPPDRSIVELPELALYYEDFGSGRADNCLVAEANDAVLLYEAVGFKTIDENAEEYIMVCEL